MKSLEDVINNDLDRLQKSFKSFEDDILVVGKENISKESESFLQHLIDCNHLDKHGLKYYIDALEAVRNQRKAFSSHMKNQIIIKHTSRKINEDEIAISKLESILKSAGIEYD